MVEERAACECAPCYCCCSSSAEIPEFVTCRVDGKLTDGCPNGHVLLVSFGIFSIIRLIRPAQYLVSAGEYVIPDKECISAGEDDPCAIFRAMAFPTREFAPPAFPPPPPADRGKCGC